MKRKLIGTRALLLTAAALGALASGCGDDVTYSYFAVKVSIDRSAPPSFLDRIAACGADVDGADTDSANLSNCVRGTVRGYDLGTFEWSTTTKNGSVRFTVNVQDGNGKLIATGASDQVPIVTGTTQNAMVRVVPLPDALMPPP